VHIIVCTGISVYLSETSRTKVYSTRGARAQGEPQANAKAKARAHSTCLCTDHTLFTGTIYSKNGRKTEPRETAANRPP